MRVLLFDVDVVFDSTGVVHCEDDDGFALVAQRPTTGPPLHRLPGFLLSVQSEVVTSVGENGDVPSPDIVMEDARTLHAGWLVDGGISRDGIGHLFRIRQ